MEKVENQSNIFQLTISSDVKFEHLYKEISEMFISEETILLKIEDNREYPYDVSNSTNPYRLTISDVFLALLEVTPNVRKIRIEDNYCRHAEHIFEKFQDIAEDYQETGVLTMPSLGKIEEFEFIRNNLCEDDLKVLASGIFLNLKRVYCYYCPPYELRIRHLYEDFIPNIEWDDKYYYESKTGMKNYYFYVKPENPEEAFDGIQLDYNCAWGW